MSEATKSLCEVCGCPCITKLNNSILHSSCTPMFDVDRAQKVFDRFRALSGEYVGLKVLSENR